MNILTKAQTNLKYITVAHCVLDKFFDCEEIGEKVIKDKKKYQQVIFVLQ